MSTIVEWVRLVKKLDCWRVRMCGKLCVGTEQTKAMANYGRRAYKSAVAITIAIVCAGAMSKLDAGGTMGLKFVLYLVTFGAGSFFALFAPATRCGLPVWRKPTKS